MPCVPGAANAAKDSPLCTECSPGKFANETGAAKCIPTRQGYFQHDSGQTQELADCGLEHRDAEMSLEWAPRGENREADALADGRTEGFAPELRVGLDFSEIAWLVLPGLMAAGMQFHGAFKRSGASSPDVGGASAASSRRKHGRLRDKEPW